MRIRAARRSLINEPGSPGRLVGRSWRSILRDPVRRRPLATGAADRTHQNRETPRLYEPGLRPRIVVGVNEHPDAAKVILAAKHLADAFQAAWTAVTVETPSTERMETAGRVRLAASLNLAAKLGGTIVTVPAATVDHGLRAQLTQSRATTLVLGKRPRKGWFELHGSVAARLMRQLPEINVYVVPLAAAGPQEPLRPIPASWRGYVLSVAFIAATTLFNVACRPFLGIDALDVIYLVPVIASATLLGLRPALLAAAAGALTYDFFFLPPVYGFGIAGPQHAVNFLVFCGVGIIAAHLAGQVRREANVGARVAADNGTVAAFSQRLGTAADAATAAQLSCEEVAALFGVATMMLTKSDHGAQIIAAAPADPDAKAVDFAAASWALTRDEASGYGTGILSVAEWQFHPLNGGTQVQAVLGIHAPPLGGVLAPHQQVLFATLKRQAALTLERLGLSEEAHRARALQQRDDLRSTLMAALCHDVRTPLTSIVAAADTLACERTGSSAAVELREAAWRLHRLLNDLMEMTRIECGLIVVRREAVDLTDAIAAAIGDLHGALENHHVQVAIPPGLPLATADQRMLHHVLINLLDNAAKFSPAGSTITIAADHGRDGLWLTVGDEGPGLPTGDETRLFQRFQRVEGGDQTGGAGLGLAIVKGFAEAMDVRVIASNRAMGPGSSFMLAWPEALVRRIGPAEYSE